MKIPKLNIEKAKKLQEYYASTKQNSLAKNKNLEDIDPILLEKLKKFISKFSLK